MYLCIVLIFPLVFFPGLLVVLVFQGRWLFRRPFCPASWVFSFVVFCFREEEFGSSIFCAAVYHQCTAVTLVDVSGVEDG